MKIVFMGTPDFAVPSLERLIQEYGVMAVFTQPDKKKGRGKKLGISEVKEVALKNNIEVFQPVKLKNEPEMIQKLKEMEPDFIIVVAFGQILNREVLDIPKYGCINLHGSLLPMYRGAAPINWAIMNGEKKSGNTTQLMDIGLDTGDMLLKDEVEIPENMTAGELYDLLKERGAGLLVETIEGLKNGSLKGEKQSDETFYAKMLNKETGILDFNLTALEVHNKVRGLNPWPIAHTTYKGESMKVYETEVVKKEGSNVDVAKIVEVSKRGILVNCKEGQILIKKVQFPNGKPLTIEQYINGHSIDKGELLG